MPSGELAGAPDASVSGRERQPLEVLRWGAATAMVLAAVVCHRHAALTGPARRPQPLYHHPSAITHPPLFIYHFHL